MTDAAQVRVSRLAAGLLLFVLACLLLPMGVVIQGSVASSQAGTIQNLIAPDEASDRVAATAAEFRVAESGAATYTIPLFTAPGTAGVAPKLSLSYNSQGGEGPIAKGWSIGGASAISRCRATREAGDFIAGGVAVDGDPAPVNFTASDRYCLDGQRLLPTSATACAAVGGMAAQAYFTEIQSYQRVCAYTPSSGASGVAFFTVERKDGSISWYGDRDNAIAPNRPDGYVNSTAAGKEAFALSWAQTRFQDSTGNYIDYVYIEGALGAVNQGEHLLSKVRYTGKTVLPGQSGAAKTPYAEIVFEYDTSGAQSRDVVAYAAGGLIKSQARLVGITSQVDHDDDGAYTSLRHYALEYGLARSADRVLASVRECRDASLVVCAAPTTFEWSTPRTSWTDTHLFQTYEQTTGVPNGSLTKFEGLKFGDIDGDGRQDMVWLKDGQAGESCPSKTVNLLYSRLDASGNPILQNAGTVFCAPNGLYWNPQDYSWFLLDYDGDGRDDYFQRTDTVWIGYRATGNAAQPFDTTVNLLAGLTHPIPSGADKYAEPQQADLNGDGLTDLVYPSGGALVARIMERGGGYGFRWGAPRTVSLLGDGCASGNCYTVSGLYRKSNYQQLNDFNADARSDLIVNVQGSCSGGGGGDPDPPGGPGGGGVQQKVGDEMASDDGVASTQSTSSCAIGMLFTVESVSASAIVLRRYSATALSDGALYSFADINGDGLSDLVHMGWPSISSGWVRVELNTGIDFVSNGQPQVQIVNYEHAQVVDINGDGRADYVYPDANGNFIAKYGVSNGQLGAGTAFGPAGQLLGCTSSECLASRSHMFVDFDGDGNVEYMRIKWDNDSNSPVTFSRANAPNRFIPRDALVRVTNGYGAKTEISYAPATLKDVYRPDQGTRNSAVWGRGSPVQDMLGPMYVVHKASSSAPQNGDPVTLSAVHYRYKGAKLQAGGRGFLGFREVLTIDPNQSGGYVTTQTQYAQNFPYVGLPTQTSKFAAINMIYAPPACLNGTPGDACFAQRHMPGEPLVGTAFSQSAQMWGAVFDQLTSFPGFDPNAQGSVMPLTLGTEEAVVDPYTAAQTSRVVTAFNYGAYLNVASTSVDTYAGTSTTPMATVITNNAYTDDASRWRLGRLTGSTVTHRRPGMPDVVRTTWFGYAMSGPTTGLLVEERLQPTGDEFQDLRKVYNLDEYGNRVFSAVCTKQVADCRSTNIQYSMWDWARIHRYSRQEYDARGRFPTRTIELFRPTGATDINAQPIETTTAQVVLRDEYGNPIEAVGLNNVRSFARFGVLGRAYYSWRQTDPANSAPNATGSVGATAMTTFRWCGTAPDGSTNGAVACSPRARFRSKTTATASPTQWVYYDTLGREVLKVSQSFNAGVGGKDAAAVCTEYDAVGRPWRVSSPFFLSGDTSSGEPQVDDVCGSPDRKWAKTEYDVLGRPVKVTEPNNAVSTVAYNGLTTTSTNARGHQKVEIKNALGELAQATDAAGLTTTYAYYAAGNLATATRNAGRGDIVTWMAYDALGRKITMVDPDAGTRHLGYNALGELLIEHDGDGKGHQQRYDFRGRVQWRGVWSNPTPTTSVWEHSSYSNFDTAPNGIGQEHCSFTEQYAYLGWQGQSDKTQQWSRCNTYDAMGRAIASATYIDGVSYPSAVIFDALGRPQRSQDPSGKWLKTQYGARGHSLRLCESSAADADPNCASGAATTYFEAQETDAFGNTVKDTRGGSAAMQTFKQYDPLTGRLTELCTGSDSVGCQIMRDRYVWDDVGNLSWRDRKSYTEEFLYDSVDRLGISRVLRVGSTTYPSSANYFSDWFHYDKLGNLCGKPVSGTQAVGLYYAGRAGCGQPDQLGGLDNSSQTQSPHQVLVAGNYRYTYDSHGNQTFADAENNAQDRTIRYTADDQAYEVFKGPAAAPNRMARFWYDPSGGRYKREDTGLGIVGTRRTLYVANLEIVTENGTTTYKRYIGGVLVQNVVNGIAANRYLFNDHIGSVVAVTNEAGSVIEGGGFNAYGERRVNDSATSITQTGYASTTRGFTGHEMLDGLDVIHMNGRIYDPTLGRFLQADPVIQDVTNPQNWNGYTYVFNNPYRYTDPSGMIGLEERQWLGTAFAIVATIFAPQGAGFWYSVFVGATAGAIAGGTKGAIMGAFSSALFFGIGEVFSGANTGSGTGFLGTGFTSGQFAAKVIAHGMAGGVMSVVQGGKFGHGFVSAAGAQLSSPVIDQIGGGAASYAGMRVAVAALIGGTLSALTGGKFASGALTAAFSRAFNDERHLIIVGHTGRKYSQGRNFDRGAETLARSLRAKGGEVTIVYAYDEEQFANALVSNGELDSVHYFGHSSPTHLYLHPDSGDQYNLGYDEVANLDYSHLKPSAYIFLWGCNTAVPPPYMLAGDSTVYKTNIAEQFYLRSGKVTAGWSSASHAQGSSAYNAIGPAVPKSGPIFWRPDNQKPATMYGADQ